MRMIDAETLKRRIIDMCLNNDDEFSILKAIDKLPTIEPEVRRGRWIVRGQEVYCSECNEESLYNPFGASKFSRFCPYCGSMNREDVQIND